MIKKNLVQSLFILLSLAVSSLPALAATYYASPSGSGTTCSLSSPCSLNNGVNRLIAGDTLYLRGGTYVQSIYISNSGTSDTNRITIAGYPGETAILDGNNYTLPGPVGATGVALIYLAGSYLTLKDVEVRYSSDTGVETTGLYNLVDSVYVHHSWGPGIVLVGNYNVAQNCKSWYNSVNNEYGRSSTGWGFGISCCSGPSYCTIRKSTAWENWGEGISTFVADHTVIEDNVSYNNWSVQYYIQNASDSTMRRNLGYRTTKNNACTSGNQIGIAVGEEAWTSHSTAGNTIANNVIMGCRRNLGMGSPTTTFTNLLVAYNTFVNSVYETNIVIWEGNGPSARFVNNIIVQEDNLPVIAGVTGGINYSNNHWSKTPASDFSGAGDVIGDPRLAKTGSVGAGQLTGEYFKILADSPARDKGSPSSGITDDFFGNKRPVGPYPDIGAHEYGGTNPDRLSAPTGLKIVNE